MLKMVTKKKIKNKKKMLNTDELLEEKQSDEELKGAAVPEEVAETDNLGKVKVIY